jgi:hypothetical protein
VHSYCLVTIEWRVFFPLPINKHSGPTRSEEYKYHLINGELLQVSSTMAVMTGGGKKKTCSELIRSSHGHFTPLPEEHAIRTLQPFLFHFSLLLSGTPTSYTLCLRTSSRGTGWYS